MSCEISILNYSPFDLGQHSKEDVFMQDMRRALKWHYQQSPEFKRLCDNRSFNPSADEHALSDIPYFPVTMFKTLDLLSVPKEQISKVLFSSSTSGTPSKIMLDKITIDRQVRAVNKILLNFLGAQRRHFIIFDTASTIKSRDGELSSRGTAIRGMLAMASKFSFLLDEDLHLSKEALRRIVTETGNGPVCYFGFTWLLYSTYEKNKDGKSIIELIKRINSDDRIVLHIGGWKKLKDSEISKNDFNTRVGNWLHVDEKNVIDFYGMTEQLGTVYPDCEYGYKHVPAYSELLVRDIKTLESLGLGQIGLLQFLSPLPHSYPGISILSDDMGKIVGNDDCRCGRRGKYFIFEKRSETAELKGCGDTVNV